MENTPDQDADVQNRYKEKLSTLVAENRSFFITGLIVLIFIVYIFLLQLGDQVIVQFKKNVSSLLSFKTEDTDNTAAIDLSQKLTNTSIDYISPSETPNKEQLDVDINGQISAISSGRVTYTKNKYIVQKGDSLASIAQKVYGDRDAWVRIAQANNLASPDLIEVGMELVIPR